MTVVTTAAQKELIISVLAALALLASGYLIIVLNPKFSLLGATTILLALFIILGLVAHSTPGAKGQVLEGLSLG